MSAPAKVKATSYAYGEAYQREQVEKFRGRRDNHWQPRIALAHQLVEKYALPRLAGGRSDTHVLADIGCSIGTMAIEFATRGFRVYGIDFDGAALTIGRELSREEGVTVEFLEGDVAAWQPEWPAAIDVAICFDIFEHLHDDELGALLQALRRRLSDRGSLVFYTFPQQFDYLFYSRDFLSWPLVPLKFLSPPAFERAVRAYASLLDAGLLMATGQTYRERIKAAAHCNPTTTARLTDVLKRAGYEIACLESTQLYPFKPGIQRRFAGQPVANRNIYGVAFPATGVR